MQALLPFLPIWDLARELGTHVPTPHRGRSLWPPFLPSSHPVLVLGPRCSGQASGEGSSLLFHAFPEDGGSTSGGTGLSLLGVNDSLPAAVLPLVLLFLPPPAHSRQGLDPGAMLLCCCQGSREADLSYAGKRPSLSKCVR